MTQNKEFNGLILKVLKTKDNKNKFILYFLIKNWSSICGNAAAKHSQPKKLEKNVLFINTDNAAWSHNFLMMKAQLINKINSIIPIEKDHKRSTRIKEIIFYNGRIQDYFSNLDEENEENSSNIEKSSLNSEENAKITKKVEENLKNEELKVIFSKLLEKNELKKKDLEKNEAHICPLCGINIPQGDKYCIVCELKVKKQKKMEIARILRNAPWISYKECINHINCDRIEYSEVRDNLREIAISKAILPKSTIEDQIYAVMLDKGVLPENIDEAMVKKTVAGYRRRKEKNVFTPRK